MPLTFLQDRVREVISGSTQPGRLITNGQGTTIDELVGILARDIQNWELTSSPIVCVLFRWWWQSIRLRGAPIWITSLTRSCKNCNPLCFHSHSHSLSSIHDTNILWLDFFPVSLAGPMAQLCYSIGSWDHESCVTTQRTYLHIMESHPVALSNDADQFLHRWVPARPVVNCLDCRRKINKDLRCIYLLFLTDGFY